MAGGHAKVQVSLDALRPSATPEVLHRVLLHRGPNAQDENTEELARAPSRGSQLAQVRQMPSF